uniref:Uncharacterized protein n=1 Tax=Arundo donax TaxID=35708 RepID=A0A0A8ZWM9_ARUDO
MHPFEGRKTTGPSKAVSKGPTWVSVIAASFNEKPNLVSVESISGDLLENAYSHASFTVLHRSMISSELSINCTAVWSRLGLWIVIHLENCDPICTTGNISSWSMRTETPSLVP